MGSTVIEGFPCLPVSLAALEAEYNNEKQRTDRLDTKAMGLLTMIIALITVYVPIIPFAQLKKVYSVIDIHGVIVLLFSLCIATGLSAIILAIVSALKLSREVQSENPQNVLRGQAAQPRVAQRNTAGGSPPRFGV